MASINTGTTPVDKHFLQTLNRYTHKHKGTTGPIWALYSASPLCYLHVSSSGKGRDRQLGTDGPNQRPDLCFGLPTDFSGDHAYFPFSTRQCRLHVLLGFVHATDPDRPLLVGAQRFLICITFNPRHSLKCSWSWTTVWP